MTTRLHHTSTHAIPAPRRRGTVYIYVLIISTIMTLIGLGLVGVNRANAEIVTRESNISAAKELARAAVELALEKIANDGTWRSRYDDDAWQPEMSLGRGTISFKLVDANTDTADGDGDLNNNSSDPVRVFGRGTVDGTIRVFSVAVESKLAPLDVLRTAAHAAGNITTSSNVTAVKGPISSAQTITVGLSAIVTGDVEAPIVANLGTITGTSTYPGPKSMPSSAIFDTMLLEATEIPFAAIADGKVERVVMSPASNPWGTANSKGIYHIRVPTGMTVQIRQSRIVGTLMVTLEGTGKIQTSGAYILEPASATRPVLLIKAGTLSGIDLNGFRNPLQESSTNTNFNPPGTPYPFIGGASDVDVADKYDALVVGVVHIICPALLTTSVASNYTSKGVLITQGALSISANAVLTADPGLLASPPIGYEGSSSLTIQTGSWRWERNDD